MLKSAQIPFSLITWLLIALEQKLTSSVFLLAHRARLDSYWMSMDDFWTPKYKFYIEVTRCH